MAYSITKQSGKDTYGVNEYIVNTTADISGVPTDDAASGSTILVISTGDVYMLSVTNSGTKTWNKIGEGE